MIITKTNLPEEQKRAIQKEVDKGIEILIVKAKKSDKNDSKWFQFSDNASVIMKLPESHTRPRDALSGRAEGTYFRSGFILSSDESNK